MRQEGIALLWAISVLRRLHHSTKMNHQDDELTAVTPPASHFFMKLVFAAHLTISCRRSLLLGLRRASRLHFCKKSRLRGTGERFAVLSDCFAFAAFLRRGRTDTASRGASTRCPRIRACRHDGIDPGLLRRNACSTPIRPLQRPITGPPAILQSTHEAASSPCLVQYSIEEFTAVADNERPERYSKSAGSGSSSEPTGSGRCRRQAGREAGITSFI